MDDKHFLSYQMFCPEGQSSITVSRSSEKEYSFVALCSTVVVLTGLVCQSVGLRAMHWSVGLMQLAATLTIQMFRCWGSHVPLLGTQKPISKELVTRPCDMRLSVSSGIDTNAIITRITSGRDLSTFESVSLLLSRITAGYGR